MVNPGRPEPGEYVEYFDTYISLVQEENIFDALEQQIETLNEFVSRVPADQLAVLHAPYTWTIKQVFGHCVDTERVFGYRAGRFAAADTASLPGFDQDEFVAHTDYDSVELAKLNEELVALRQSNLLMLQRQSETSWLRSGVADGKSMTVRAAAYILVGHVRYHLNIVAKRLGW